MSSRKPHLSVLRWLAAAALLAGAGLALGARKAPEPPQPPAPETPRDFFNAGTRMLREGKLKEAEAFFESTLSAQIERWESPAAYNLGHVRFGQGLEELKKGPAAGPVSSQGHSIAQAGQEANRQADDALAGEDVQKMVAAYLRGRGTRRELKAATKAVKRAMETHGAALNKWERSSGDFKSALELNQADADARQNAETVDRCIAKLVDTLRELQQMAAALAKQNQELGEKMKQLKGRIPAPDMPPGAAGDEDDDDDQPNGPKPGDKEGPTKSGDEMMMSLTREQAGWLLQGFRLDSEHRLPMGQQDTGDPKNLNRKPW